MLIDVQMGWHDSTVHVQGFSCQKKEQMIMTSFGDITVIMLMYRAGSIKENMHRLGALVWVSGCCTFGHTL